LALTVNKYLNDVIIIQLITKLPLLAPLFRHLLCYSAASNGATHNMRIPGSGTRFSDAPLLVDVLLYTMVESGVLNS